MMILTPMHEFLGLCKIVNEVITEQKLSEFLITADDIINSSLVLMP